MRGYLEDLKAGGRPMTDKELAEHYKHLYSEVKKQKDDVVDYIKSYNLPEDLGHFGEAPISIRELREILRMLGEEDVED